ncbi:hypothetical protein DEU56DRAFT_776647, partial [Suillus clintonianus]|uniref:uncharacterized protein n=1 Tax=Suillus clintonianus TaxID=1904413 RepID=UPI001B87B3A4
MTHPSSSPSYDGGVGDDTGTIAGAMQGLNLTPATPSTSTSLPAHAKGAHQGSSLITAPMDPNLRFIFERRYQAARARELSNPVCSSVINESPASTEPQNPMSEVSEVVHHQPNGTVDSIDDVIGTPPPTSTVMEDAIDLTLGSDEGSSPLQKQPTQKQKNILSTSIKVNTAKRRVDSDSSDTSEDGPRKRRKRTGALPRSDSDSATSDTDNERSHVPPQRLSIEPPSSSRYSTSSVEVTDTPASGPRSIADAYNNGIKPSVSLDDAPRHSAQESRVSVVVRTRNRPNTGSAVASSSRVRMEDMEVSDAEANTGDPQRARLYSSAISRKVRLWAEKLKGIPRAHLDSLFDDSVVGVSPFSSYYLSTNLRTFRKQVVMSKAEILELLREIDEDKNWATRAEVEDSRLERFLVAVVTEHLVNGTEAYRLAIRILDNFAQRFRGQRYPQTR